MTTPVDEELHADEPNRGILIITLTDGEVVPEPDGTRVDLPATSE
jgi:hypothetical protein